MNKRGSCSISFFAKSAQNFELQEKKDQHIKTENAIKKYPPEKIKA